MAWFTEQQMATALRQGEAATPMPDIVRKLRISEQPYYTWKKTYGCIAVSESRELNAIREENRRPWEEVTTATDRGGTLSSKRL